MYIINKRFEWDDKKAQANSLKHGVRFEEAVTVFQDPRGMITPDLSHSWHEHRQWLVGESIQRRILVVVFTLRAESVIRIISARPAKRKERIFYEPIQGISV